MLLIWRMLNGQKAARTQAEVVVSVVLHRFPVLEERPLLALVAPRFTAPKNTLLWCIMRKKKKKGKHLLKTGLILGVLRVKT